MITHWQKDFEIRERKVTILSIISINTKFQNYVVLGFTQKLVLYKIKQKTF